MKFLNKYSMTVALMITMLACQKDDWAPYPDWNDHVGAATKITVNPNRNSFKISNGLVNEFIEFDLDVDGYDLTRVSSVELQVTFFEGSPVRTVGPVLLKTIDTFPSTVQVSAQEVVALIGGGFTIDQLQNNDRFRLTFPINTADGRRLTVALNSELCTNAAQPLSGSCQVQWNVVN
jgi:hypothetical protein